MSNTQPTYSNLKDIMIECISESIKLIDAYCCVNEKFGMHISDNNRFDLIKYTAETFANNTLVLDWNTSEAFEIYHIEILRSTLAEHINIPSTTKLLWKNINTGQLRPITETNISLKLIKGNNDAIDDWLGNYIEKYATKSLLSIPHTDLPVIHTMLFINSMTHIMFDTIVQCFELMIDRMSYDVTTLIFPVSLALQWWIDTVVDNVKLVIRKINCGDRIFKFRPVYSIHVCADKRDRLLPLEIDVHDIHIIKSHNR